MNTLHESSDKHHNTFPGPPPQELGLNVVGLLLHFKEKFCIDLHSSGNLEETGKKINK